MDPNAQPSGARDANAASLAAILNEQDGSAPGGNAASPTPADPAQASAAYPPAQPAQDIESVLDGAEPPAEPTAADSSTEGGAPAEPPAEAAAEDDPFEMDLELPGEEEGPLDEEPKDPEAAAGGDPADEIKAILGDGSKKLNRDERDRLHDIVFLGTERGKRYHSSYKFKRDLDKAFGRDVDPQFLMDRVSRGQELDGMIQSLQSGDEGAKAVFETWLRGSNGQDRPWAEGIRSAAREALAPEFEAARAESASRALTDVLDELSSRAADAYAAADKDNAAWMLNGANAIHTLLTGRRHPQIDQIVRGKYERGQISLQRNGAAPTPTAAAPKQDPQAPPQTDPERERLLRENEALRMERLRGATSDVGYQLDTIMEATVAKGLAPLEKMVEKGIVTKGIYDAALLSYQQTVEQKVGPESARIGRIALDAIRRGDAAQLEFCKRELQSAVNKVVRETYKEALEPYRGLIQRSNGQTRETQARQLQAGQRTEPTAASPGAAPSVKPKMPDGTVDGNANWLAASLA